MRRLTRWIWQALSALGATAWTVVHHPVDDGPVDLTDDDHVRAAFEAIVVREFGDRSGGDRPVGPVHPSDGAAFYFGWGRMF